MPRTSRNKRGSKKHSRKSSKKSSKRSSKTISMSDLIPSGKLSDTYDPLNLLEFRNNRFNHLINPISMPLMMPGIIQRKAIFTPTGPGPIDLKFPEQQMAQYLFTPSINNQQQMIGGQQSITGSGAEDLDALSAIYMQNPMAFMQTMQPAGLMSTFLEQYPYYKFASNFKHPDEADLVINKDSQRPNEVLNVSAPGNNDAIPNRLAIATPIDL